MSKTNIIVIIVAVCLIIMCLFTINKKPADNNNQNATSQVMETDEMIVNQTINESGEDEYIVYDKKTGAEKTRVTEEYQLKIYETNPDYEELPVPKVQDEGSFEENAVEQSMIEE